MNLNDEYVHDQYLQSFIPEYKEDILDEAATDIIFRLNSLGVDVFNPLVSDYMYSWLEGADLDCEYNDLVSECVYEIANKFGGK